MLTQWSRFMAVLGLCGLLVQSAQAEPAADPPVEAEHQAATQQKTEPKEITIYIPGEHRAEAEALLDVVDEGTPVTGIADFDSLSSAYGLLGIYRKGRRSSGFYGHRFRLTFPSAADVAAIAGAYWNLPYVQSVEPKPPGQGTDKRISKKWVNGVLMGSLSGFISGSLMFLSIPSGGDGLGQPAVFYFFGLLGYPVGAAVGVSQVDPHDRFVASLMGSLLGNASGFGLAAITGNPYVLLVCPVASVALAVWMSEGSRDRLAESASKPPEVSRFSVGLEPRPRGHLSVIAKLRF